MKSVESGWIRVAVWAADPVSAAGIVSMLRANGELVVVSWARRVEADVMVLAPGRLSADVLSVMRRDAREVGKPVVLVADTIDESDVAAVVECRVLAILLRESATSQRLLHSVHAAASGGATMPSDLLADLLKRVECMRYKPAMPQGADVSLDRREVDVLRLVAEGFDTAEIASKLCYSQRTVKNVIYGVTNRLQLRNRPHAVAYAVRSGMI